MNNKQWFIFLFFLLLVAFLRFSTFFQSDIDPDESLYLLMSQSILNGQVPYVTVWDQKPPGIYILFSLAQLLLGHSVISIRIFACISITVTCYLLYKLENFIFNKVAGIGLLTGILYAFFSLTNTGLAANTEIFFTPFVVFAFYLLFSNEAHLTKHFNYSTLKLFIIGLVIGIGIQIKYLVVFDFIAILAVISINLYLQSVNNKKYVFRKILKSYMLLMIGAILPFFSVAFYFVMTGHFEDYFYANFTANKIYSIDNPFSLMLFLKVLIEQQFAANNFLWICVFLLPFYLMLDRKISLEEKRKNWFLILWLLMALLSACFTKRYYPHYFLQLLPPLCMLSSYIIMKTIFTAKIDVIKQYFILSLLLLPVLTQVASNPVKMSLAFIKFRYVKGNSYWNDDPALIASYLQKRIKKQDYVYVVDYETITYYLTSARIPTKYIFSKWLTNKEFSHYSGSNPIQELNLVMKKKPLYIIRQDRKYPDPNLIHTDRDNDSFYAALDNYMKSNYGLETIIHGVEIYKIKNP